MPIADGEQYGAVGTNLVATRAKGVGGCFRPLDSGRRSDQARSVSRQSRIYVSSPCMLHDCSSALQSNTHIAAEAIGQAVPRLEPGEVRCVISISCCMYCLAWRNAQAQGSEHDVQVLHHQMRPRRSMRSVLGGHGASEKPRTDLG